MAKTGFFTIEVVFFALSTHFGQHEDQSQIDISDEETWVTHVHVDEVDQLVTMTFIFSLDALLKILLEDFNSLIFFPEVHAKISKKQLAIFKLLLKSQ